MLAIVVPMAIEATEIRRALCRIPDAGAMLYISGIGGERAAAAIAWLADSPPRPDAVIMAGFCGALEPGLNTGDIHIAPSFYASGQTESIAADASLIAAVTDAAALCAGVNGIAAAGAPSVTVAAIAQPEAKADLRRYGATVNMEDYWAAQAAAAVGIPLVAVRAVLDTAEQSLPAYAGAAVDRPGLIPVKMAAGIVRHPGRLPELRRLRRQLMQARRSLTRCVLASASALQAATAAAAEMPAAAEARR